MEDIRLRSRKSASAEQLSGLLEFMKEHVELAKGKYRGIHGRMISRKLWSQCATKLNAMSGAPRNVRGWAKYWNDWKCRVRRKAMSIHLATKFNTPLTDSTPLSAFDLDILSLIGKPNDSIVVRNSLAGDSDEEGDQDDDNVDESANVIFGESSAETSEVVSRKRRHSSIEPSEFDQSGSCPSSSKRLTEDVSYFNVDDYEIKSRKKVSIEQLLGLVQFVQEHPSLARPGPSRGKLLMASTRRLWRQCADRLNALRGTPRSARAWTKYWTDWKGRVRTKALDMKTVKESISPAVQCTPLNELEEIVLDLIGMPRDSVERDDPLAVEAIDEEEGDEIDNDETSRIQDYGQSSRDKGPDQSAQIGDDSSLEPPDLDQKESLVDAKPVQIDVVDSDGQINVTNDEAAEFLRIERDKLQSSERLINAVLGVKSEVSRLTDVLSQIKDMLASKL